VADVVMAGEDQNEDESDKYEINSGVDFPGQCLEPLLNSALRISALTLNNNSTMTVEFRPE
jgi:hypothetical protein